MTMSKYGRWVRAVAVVASCVPIFQFATAAPASAGVLISPPIIELTWRITYDPTSVTCTYQQTAEATVSFAGVGFFQVEAFANNGAEHGGLQTESRGFTSTYEAVGTSVKTWTILQSACYPLGAHGLATSSLDFYNCDVDCGGSTARTLIAGKTATCHWGHIAATC